MSLPKLLAQQVTRTLFGVEVLDLSGIIGVGGVSYLLFTIKKWADVKTAFEVGTGIYLLKFPCWTCSINLITGQNELEVSILFSLLPLY